MAYLVLVRHGRSEWNIKGLWTGWIDVPLAPEGFEDAHNTGKTLKDITFQQAFTSSQIRAVQTLDVIKQELGQEIPTQETTNLWERHYGIYVGKNKWEMKDILGEEKFMKLRRSWNHPVPEGETVKDVYDRVVPYYKEEILPLLHMGKNILVTASGNSLRTLVKYIENISDNEIANLEFGIAEAYVYQVDKDGKIISKEIRAANPNKGKI